jgi:hypothetical protein
MNPHRRENLKSRNSFCLLFVQLSCRWLLVLRFYRRNSIETRWVVSDMKHARYHSIRTEKRKRKLNVHENYSEHKLTTFFWLARQNVQTGDRCAPSNWWSEEKFPWGWAVGLRQGWSTGPKQDVSLSPYRPALHEALTEFCYVSEKKLAHTKKPLQMISKCHREIPLPNN